MGWLSMTLHGMAPHATPKTYLDDQMTYRPDPEKGRGDGLRVLKSAVRSGAYYAACQSYGAEGEGAPFAMICLVRWNPRAKDGFVVGYKDMAETAGPYYFDCPASILDLLGPPINDHAAQWRAKCRQRLALTSRRKPMPGDTLLLPEPLTFSDGIREQTFRVVPWGTKTMLLRAGDGAGVRISHLMSRAWTIVRPDAAAAGSPAAV